jgi:ubiquinone/menaquinone biosynthesis C-methylase UbiE
MADKHFIVDAFTDIASHYEQVVDGELQKFWGWTYDGFIQNLIDLTPLGENDRVLDVASGTAVIPLKLIERGKTAGKIVGLDITYAMLARGKQKVEQRGASGLISLTCGNAMAMPFRNDLFDVVVCGLATHHLNVDILLNEIWRLLRPGGRLTIADVGGSAAWHLPLVSSAIRTATFFYFLPKEGYARARVESEALTNVLTPSEWENKLSDRQFTQIQVTELPKSHAWAPAPLLMRAVKVMKEDSNENCD